MPPEAGRCGDGRWASAGVRDRSTRVVHFGTLASASPRHEWCRCWGRCCAAACSSHRAATARANPRNGARPWAEATSLSMAACIAAVLSVFARQQAQAIWPVHTFMRGPKLLAAVPSMDCKCKVPCQSEAQAVTMHPPRTFNRTVQTRVSCVFGQLGQVGLCYASPVPLIADTAALPSMDSAAWFSPAPDIVAACTLA